MRKNDVSDAIPSVPDLQCAWQLLQWEVGALRHERDALVAGRCIPEPDIAMDVVGAQFRMQ